MKTNNKQVREEIKNHILDCVLNEEGNNFNNIKDACKYMYSEFDRVANYPFNLKKIPNSQDRFKDYLQGVPFGFYIYYSDMNYFLNSLGINPDNKKYSDDKLSSLYSYLIYSEMLKNN